MTVSVSIENSASSVFYRDTLSSGKNSDTSPAPRKEKTPEQLLRAARKAADADYL